MEDERLERVLTELSERLSALEGKVSESGLRSDGRKNGWTEDDGTRRAEMSAAFMKTDRVEALGKLREALSQVSGVLDDFEIGATSLAASCASHGITYTKFLRFCDKISYIDGEGREVLRELNGDDFITNEERLYSEVFRMPVSEAVKLMPPDVDEAIEAAYKHLREREADVLRRRLEGKTLKGIGEEDGLSRERIRQIEAKALWRLRQPHIKEILRYGPVAIEESNRMLLARRYELAKERFEKECEKQGLTGDGVDEPPAMRKPVSELGLSVRAYNVLHRHGITTLGEIIQKSESELAKMRNMGQKSVEEIKRVVKSYGYTLASKNPLCDNCEYKKGYADVSD